MSEVAEYLLKERENKIKNGLYHYTQISFAYNSNHIEGSTLTEEQTRSIYETDSFLSQTEQVVRANDIVETKNHFRAFDFILDSYVAELDGDYLKKLHAIIKQGCSDIAVIGEYKTKPNYIGTTKTTPPSQASKQIGELLFAYKERAVSVEDIIGFHHKFESIHPFEDGNGRVGRLIAFKECLKNNIAPFIIDEAHRLFYYRGLKEYGSTRGYLIDTCLACQDAYKEILFGYGIAHDPSDSRAMDNFRELHTADRAIKEKSAIIAENKQK